MLWKELLCLEVHPRGCPVSLTSFCRLKCTGVRGRYGSACLSHSCGCSVAAQKLDHVVSSVYR